MHKHFFNGQTIVALVMSQDSRNAYVSKLTAIMLLICSMSFSGCTVMFTRTFDRIPMTFTFEDDGSCSLTLKGKQLPHVYSIGNLKGDPASRRQHSWTCEVVVDDHSGDSFDLRFWVPYYWVSLEDLSLGNAYAVKGSEYDALPQGEGDQTILFASIRSSNRSIADLGTAIIY